MKNALRITALCMMMVLLMACHTAADSYTENPIKVNQVGYYPHAVKTATIESWGWAENYTLTNAYGKVVWQGKAVRTATSPFSPKQRQVIDFTDVTDEGEYTLSNGTHQQKIIIKYHALRQLVQEAMGAFYMQRSGERIFPGLVGDYERPAAHMDTLVLVHPSAASENRPAGTVISCPGGWYDAGDYNKYIVNSAFSVALMLYACENNPLYFMDLKLCIPECEDETPDFLDELLVNLRWMLTMQDPDDGGVYHKLTTPQFEEFIKPSECKQTRYVVQKSSTATLGFAACMARAAYIYGSFPSIEYQAFAHQALGQAEKAYAWALKNGTVLYDQDEMNKLYEPSIVTGTYGDKSDADERYWATVELRLCTGKALYNDVYCEEQMWNYDRVPYEIPTWGNVMGLAHYFQLNHTLPDPILRYSLMDYADKYLARAAGSCFDSPYGNSTDDFGWGCNGEQCCGLGIALLYAYRLSKETKYLVGALQVADYLLGRNATGYCYVTGFGTKSPMHPHHRLSASDDVLEPLPGFLVGGPNNGMQDATKCKSYTSTLPDECYADDVESYASNEVAINWNASLVAFLGWLDAEMEALQ